MSKIALASRGGLGQLAALLWLLFSISACESFKNLAASEPSYSESSHSESSHSESSQAPPWSALHRDLLSGQLPPPQLGQKGPYPMQIFSDLSITLSPKHSVTSDFYLSTHKEAAPLVIIVHGNTYSKAAHRLQARRLASWGFHCLILDLPNRYQWLRNGKKIAELVRLIHAYPPLLSSRIDAKRIFLVGHSFGGSAVTVAAGKQAPTAGVILLDPAVVGPSVTRAMAKVRVPVILLGADPLVFMSKKRWQFFASIPTPMAEVSIVGATHTDAQYPSIQEAYLGFDLATDAKHQELFVTSLLAGLFSLAKNGSLDYAWQVYETAAKHGLMKNTRLRAEFVPGIATKNRAISLKPTYQQGFNGKTLGEEPCVTPPRGKVAQALYARAPAAAACGSKARKVTMFQDPR